MKTCKKCGGIEYTKSGHCKECQKIKARVWYENNKEKTKARSIQWKKENPEKVKIGAKVYRDSTTDQMKILQSAWRKANPEKVKVISLRFYNSHKEECKSRSRNWYSENPVKAKQVRDAYRSTDGYRAISVNNSIKRKTRLKGKISKSIIANLMTLQQGKCPCCGKKLGNDFHIDHILPLALGGENADDNIQLLRSQCNLQKHAKHPIAFMQSRGFLL